MKYGRTERILELFHMFCFCHEVSFGHIRKYYVSEYWAVDRTIIRDIRLLKEAGLIKARYSKKDRAYVPSDGDCFVPKEFRPLKLPEKKNQRIYMEKIIRLCTLMTDVVMSEEEDPLRWYRKKYPQLSERTRQRDFKTLYKVGYVIEYCPKDEEDQGCYCYDYPCGL